MKAVGYIRVSTKELDENNQKTAIKQFCKSKNIELVGFFIDKGVSGIKPFKERDGAKELLNFIKNNKVDAVIVYAIDRLGREMNDIVSTINMFENKNIKVLSVKEEFINVDNKLIRKIILDVLAWFAEFERNRILERMEAARLSGKNIGRPRVISDSDLENYIKNYPTLRKADLLKIIKADGYNISYQTLHRRLKALGYEYVNGRWIKVENTVQETVSRNSGSTKI